MKAFIFAAATALMASSASAGNWTGSYVGYEAGYSDVSNSGAQGSDGYSYGVYGGYNHDFGLVVLGGELEYDGGDIDVNNNGSMVENMGRAKVKLGYDFGPTMGYVIAGGAKAYTNNLGDGSGYLYGLGLAYQVSPLWAVSAEVMHHEFSNFNSSGLDIDADTMNLRASFRF